MKSLITLVSVLLIVGSLQASEIKIAVGEDAIKLAPGITSDLHRLYSELGYEPVIDVLPDRRAILLTVSGKYDALDARLPGIPILDQLVLIEVPIYRSQNALAWSMNGHIKIETLEDLTQYNIVIGSGMAASMHINEFLGGSLEYVEDQERAIQMVENDRAELLLAFDVTMEQFKARGIGVELNPVSPVLWRGWTYHRLHPRMADQAATITQKIKELQKEGLFLIYE